MPPAASSRKRPASRHPPRPTSILGAYRYSSGKLLTVFAAEAPDFDPPEITPGTFDLEWPPRSGRIQQFPEIDKAAWTPIDEARSRLVKAQHPLLDDLLA